VLVSPRNSKSETKSTLGPLRISLYILYEFLIKPATAPVQKQTQRTDSNYLGTQWARSSGHHSTRNDPRFLRTAGAPGVRMADSKIRLLELIKRILTHMNR
jgi:hypothetical protein